MPPFVNEEDDNFDIDYFNREDNQSWESKNVDHPFLERDDKRFFLIGGIAALFTFIVILYIMYSSSKPIDLDDLPVIRADTTPIKVKPPKNGQVSHQDKIVYDNISGYNRKVAEKTAPPPEEILPINKEEEIFANEDTVNGYTSSSSENKTTKATRSKGSGKIRIVEERLPIKKIEADNSRKVKKQKISNLIKKVEKGNVTSENSDELYGIKKGGNIMLQIASMHTKAAAEVEYKRVVNRNKFLKRFNKKIEKIDLGRKKGIIYRVKVGPFRNKSDAQKAIDALKKKGFSTYISR